MADWTRIVDNTGRFAGFDPYVPAVDDRGVVTFQATLRGGGSGVYHGDGGALTTVAQSGPLLAEVTSHPDRADDGTTCFYATSPAGEGGVVRVRGSVLTWLETGPSGPLGPTVDPRGRVAYRAQRPPGVFLADVGDPEPITVPGPVQGLPVVTDAGVVVRSESGGRPGIWLAADGAVTAAVHGEPYVELGRFPSADRRGRIAFVATLSDRDSGVFRVDGGRVLRVIDRSAGFAAFRGALIDGSDRVVFLATPTGGALGVYGPERLVGLGDPLFGSVVTDFALNPVSLADAGWLALRVTLADGLQVVLRADPPLR